jgi:hypothetical protein
MESTQSRRRFLERCAQIGGSCCALFIWNKHLSAKNGTEDEKKTKTDAIDLKKVSYCGILCEDQCELFKATKGNNAALKKKMYDQWNWKEKFKIEFDPEKVFCWGCKPKDKPLKIGMNICEVRVCAIENGIESCIQCKDLVACDKAFWKNWVQFYDQVKKMQGQYSTPPGAALVELKTKPVVKQ